MLASIQFLRYYNTGYESFQCTCTIRTDYLQEAAMRKYRVGLALFLILIMLFTCMPIMAQAEKTNTGTIIKDNIFFRSRATTSSGWSRRFKKGDVVEIIGEEGDFYKVTYLKKTGYVMKKFVSLSSSASTTLKKTEPIAAPAKAKATATPKAIIKGIRIFFINKNLFLNNYILF